MRIEIAVSMAVWGPHRNRINKDDLACAICARLNGRLKRREKRGTMIVEVAEDVFISGLVGIQIKRVVDATNIPLLHRILDANKRGKTPLLFDRYDIWLLSNWRTLQLNGKKLPGLREWSVPAIEKLGAKKFPAFTHLTAMRIKRLGRKPGNRVFYDTDKGQFVRSS
jgi:hypothetical protein